MSHLQLLAPVSILRRFSARWASRTLLLLWTLSVAGCIDASWHGDVSGPTPLAWQRLPATAGWKHPHIYYEFSSRGVVAYVRPLPFFLPYHAERAERIGPHRGVPGNFMYDMTFHGVTDRYWAHFGRPGEGGILTVVAPNARPDPVNDPGSSH